MALTSEPHAKETYLRSISAAANYMNRQGGGAWKPLSSLMRRVLFDHVWVDAKGESVSQASWRSQFFSDAKSTLLGDVEDLPRARPAVDLIGHIYRLAQERDPKLLDNWDEEVTKCWLVVPPSEKANPSVAEREETPAKEPALV